MASSGIFKHQKLYIDRPSWYSMTDELQEIIDACDSIKALLLSKNEKYGNSALKPVTVFSKLNSAEAIKARIDDNVSFYQNKRGREDFIINMIWNRDFTEQLWGHLTDVDTATPAVRSFIGD